jgi:hypothetical protein
MFDLLVSSLRNTKGYIRESFSIDRQTPQRSMRPLGASVASLLLWHFELKKGYTWKKARWYCCKPTTTSKRRSKSLDVGYPIWQSCGNHFLGIPIYQIDWKKQAN